MSFLSITKILIKNIFHGPYTTLYPIEKKDNYENTRGRIENKISECIFCGICERRCPTVAIKVDKEIHAWSIQRFQCIQCGYCVEVCPKKCLVMNSQYTAPSTGKMRAEYTDA
ncbi:MAG: 4Fe-4S dicluster domain-containing protein [Clostridia bacterium]